MSQNPDIIAAVEHCVTAEPSSHKEIWRRVNCWSPQTIHRTLEHLRSEGRIVGTVEPIPGGFMRKYSRAA